MKNKSRLHKMVLAALFLAIAYLMPFLTGQIPEIGKMLCPLHIPILLCGFICGPIFGGVVGFIAPLLRSITLGVPVFFPNAVCMTFELAVYGAVAGIMHKILPPKKPYIYCSLLTAMVAGRIIWGIAMLIALGLSGKAFTFAAFIAGAFTKAIPGIIVQIVLIPVLTMAFENSRSNVKK